MEILKGKFDIFAIPPVVFADKQIKISTKISNFFSSLFYLLAIIVFLDTITIFVTNQKYNLNSIDTYRDQSTSIDIDHKLFMLSIKFANKKLQLNFSKYFTMQYQYQAYDNTEENYIVNQTQPMELCTFSHFPQIDKNIYNDLNLNQSFCIPQNYQASLISNGTFEQYSQISVNYRQCEQNEADCIDLRNSSNQQNFINEYGSENYLEYRFTNTQFDVQRIDNPTKVVLDFDYLVFNPEQNIYQSTLFNIQNYEVQQDQRKFVVWENIDKYNGVFTTNSDIKEKTVYQNSLTKKKVFQINLYPNTNQKKYIVVYQKITDFILQIQASLGMALFLFGFLCRYSNKNYFILQTSNLIQSTRMNFTIFEILSGYTPSLILSQKQIKKVIQSLDISFVAHQALRTKFLIKKLFSSKSRDIAHILQQKPESLKKVQEKIYQIYLKNNKQSENTLDQIVIKKNTIFQKFLKNKIKVNDDQQDFQSSQKNRIDSQPQSNIKQQDEEILSNKQQQNNSQMIYTQNQLEENGMLEQDIENYFNKFMESLSEMNTLNTQKNVFDILIETEFHLFLQKNFQYVSSYDTQKKIQQFNKLHYNKHDLKSIFTDFIKKHRHEEQIESGKILQTLPKIENMKQKIQALHLQYEIDNQK